MERTPLNIYTRSPNNPFPRLGEIITDGNSGEMSQLKRITVANGHLHTGRGGNQNDRRSRDMTDFRCPFRRTRARARAGGTSATCLSSRKKREFRDLRPDRNGAKARAAPEMHALAVADRGKVRSRTCDSAPHNSSIRIEALPFK